MLIFEDRLGRQQWLRRADMLFKLLQCGPGSADLRTGQFPRAEGHENPVVQGIAVQLDARHIPTAVVCENGLIHEILGN